jgi:hypothetical protein
MILVTTLFARRADEAQAYDEVVVPFLDRMIMDFRLPAILSTYRHRT